MICFLTSNPFLHGGGLNPANGFVDTLTAALPRRAVRCVFVASSPDEPETNDFYAAEQKAAFEDAEIRFKSFDILDRRSEASAPSLVKRADLIVLTGGHVPTQNRFFQRIGLRELLHGFSGVVVGISAGSMNAADVVYAQPEEPGEALDPAFRRFLPGLGVTRAMILPHYGKAKYDYVDGLRLIEDITFPDSMGRVFYALPDGSYLLGSGGREVIYGEAYRIRDGRLERVSEENGCFDVPAL